MKLRVELVFDALWLDDATKLGEDFLEEASVHFFDLTSLAMLGQFKEEGLCTAEVFATVNLTQKQGEEGGEADFSFRGHLLQVRVHMLG